VQQSSKLRGHHTRRTKYNVYKVINYQRDAGTVWAWATTIHACRETSPSFY